MKHKGAKRIWTGPMSRTSRAFILPRDGFLCQSRSPECESPWLPLPPDRLEVDHIHPIHQGGAVMDAENLQTICISCHRRKTAREKGHRRTSPPRDDRRRLSPELDDLAVRR